MLMYFEKFTLEEKERVREIVGEGIISREGYIEDRCNLSLFWKAL